MTAPLRVLHLEDNARDAELVQATLETEGLATNLTRVETEQDFVAALQPEKFDVVLADYTLPSFDGLSALQVAQKRTPDLPFIFVSGTLGEDVAIEALKHGATDYVLKTRLARLAPSVQRALGEAREKAERKRAEAALRASEELWRATFECNPTMYFMVDSSGIVLSVNAYGAERLGYTTEELLGRPVLSIFHEADKEAVRKNADSCFEHLNRTMQWEARKLRKDGTVIWVRETANALLLKNQPVLLVVCEDVTDRKQAEEAVRHSERELRNLIETIPAMAFVSRVDGSNEYVSRPWIEYSGMTAEQTAGGGWESTLHPDDVEQHLAKWCAAHATGQTFENEARHRDAQGNYRWLLVRAVPFRDEEGNVLKWYGTAVDIEDRKHAEALLAGEKRILEMVAKGDSLAQILDTLCRLVEEQANGVLASILLLEGDRLRHGGAPSLPKAYTDAINGTAIGPCAGSCGTAAYRHQQVIVEDIATDPRWADYRAVALGHGLRACWSTPILSSRGKVIGTFAMYYREPRSPSASDQQTIEQITHLAGIAIERKLVQETLTESEAYLAEAQKLSHTGSWAWTPATGEIRYWSDETYRVLGFNREDGPPRFDDFFQRVAPDDQVRLRTAFERAIQDKATLEAEYRVIHPNGRTRDIHVVGNPVCDEANEVVEFVGTVIDITERKSAEALLTGEKRLLEMVATGVPLKEILNDLCLIIEQQRPGTLASALMLNADGVHLDCVAGPNLPNEWKQQMEKLPIGPCAGSCGTAAYRGSAVIVSDIAHDPLWDVPEHRASALQHGLHASWSNPVLSSKGQVLGTFCIYNREPRAPGSQDLELIDLATHLVRVAIERDRAEEALRSSEQLARSHVDVMMRSLDVLATEAAPEKFIGELLRMIGQHLHAIRVLLWLRNANDETLQLNAVIEHDTQVPVDLEHPLVKDPHAWKNSAFIQEMLFTKSPVVIDNSEEDSRISPEFREHLARQGCRRFMTIPMFVSGEVRGFIGIQHSEQGSYRIEEIELAQALAHHVMLAWRGQELLQKQREAAILKERTRMARDIHDTLAQGFTGVIVQLEAVADAISSGDHKESENYLRRASELARSSLDEARRSVHALRPEALRQANFWDALKGIIKNTTAGSALCTRTKLHGKVPELPPDWQENLMHIGQEALTNTLKYAHADTFEARLTCDRKELRLELRDDGHGFVMEDKHDGFGLAGMRERVEQMGGELRIASSRRKGTSITVLLPTNGKSVL